jgi:hypothetical protein
MHAIRMRNVVAVQGNNEVTQDGLSIPFFSGLRTEWNWMGVGQSRKPKHRGHIQQRRSHADRRGDEYYSPDEIDAVSSHFDMGFYTRPVRDRDLADRRESSYRVYRL